MKDPDIWSLAAALIAVGLALDFWQGPFNVVPSARLAVSVFLAVVLAVWALAGRTPLLGLGIIGLVLTGLLLLGHVVFVLNALLSGVIH